MYIMYIPKTAIVVFLFFMLHSVAEGKNSKILTLTSSNWHETLEGEWVIKFYAPWCPACRSMEEDYKKFAEWADDLNIQVAEVNINDEPGLSGRFIVTALPSLYHAKNGEYRRYTAARDTNTLHRFIEDQVWMKSEPVGWYRHPNSIPMSMMSGLFQTSVIMKNFHEMLTETYGFSTTMSYVIFALVTIVTGLVLGLIMVFIIDCIAPPKGRAKGTVVPSAPVPVEEDLDVDNKSDEDEEVDVQDERASTGTSSNPATDDEKEKVEQIGENEGSSEEENGERHSSRSSSRTSQEWEQVQGIEAEETEKLEVEKILPADEPEEGKGELRKRVTAKSAGDEKKEE